MIDTVLRTIKKYNMIKKGDGIIVGLSGGPDSVSLVHILNKLKTELNISLYAAHVNHMLRGIEADRDEKYSQELCESMNIPFYLKRIDVHGIAKEQGLSFEEAGRLVRYDFFDEVSKTAGATKIALGHNMNDQAETMLMRFMRGSGISGIAGIRPVRDERYIRPLIDCSRDEIEAYCSGNMLDPITDSSNKENVYSRNRVRLEMIPYIKEHFNPNIIESLWKISDIFRDEDDYISEICNIELDKIVTGNGISISKFGELHVALKRRIIRRLIENIKGSLTGIEIKHVEDIIKLIHRGDTGKYIELPGGIQCSVNYDEFKIHRKTDRADFNYNLIIPGRIYVHEVEMTVYAEILEGKPEEFTDKQFIKFWDYDKIKGELSFRSRQDGDFIHPKGMNGRKKVKNVFIDKKIPREDRDRIPLLALGSEILWIVGLRDSGSFKVEAATKRILKIEIKKGE